MIAIIDYGAGNLHSVKNALDFLGAQSVITGNAEEILKADKVILPGVGSFGDALFSLRKNGLDKVVKEVVKNKTPLLGICLGLQMMFEESEESPGVEGLGIFKGKIVKIPDTGLKIPHMGWNN
ncbi:MAG: imidazole glycerol phosphate synthase subunit HisH, partial [Clostridia bacterium]|nr:imidazole glycerol phosphate synthase subunit HisH [Clostridia bacterium]